MSEALAKALRLRAAHLRRINEAEREIREAQQEKREIEKFLRAYEKFAKAGDLRTPREHFHPSGTG